MGRNYVDSDFKMGLFCMDAEVSLRLKVANFLQVYNLLVKIAE